MNTPELETKIREMLELQNALNIRTNGLSWKKGFNEFNGRKINWYRAISQECSELLDSYSWAHWKDVNKEIDMNNIKVECVDILHFALSEILRSFSCEDGCDSGDEDMVEFFLGYLNKKQEELNSTDIEIHIELIEEMIVSALYFKNIGRVLIYFFQYLSVTGISFDDLYDLYMGKNVLNGFRQDNGYETGEYVKHWADKDGNKQEDNVFMQKMVNDNPGIAADDLYQMLEKHYKSMSALGT